MVAAEDEKFSTIRHATCEHLLSGDEGTERCGGCSNQAGTGGRSHVTRSTREMPAAER